MLKRLTEIKDHHIKVANTTDLEALYEDMELPTFGLLTPVTSGFGLSFSIPKGIPVRSMILASM